MKAIQGAEREPRPLQRDRQDDRELRWGQTDSLEAEGKLRVPGLDLFDRLHDSVLHAEEDGSRKRKGYERG